MQQQCDKKREQKKRANWREKKETFERIKRKEENKISEKNHKWTKTVLDEFLKVSEEAQI